LDRQANDDRARADRETQAQQRAQEIRDELIAAMTRAASDLYMHLQIYWRAKGKDPGIGAEPARQLLHERYVAVRVEGEVIEQRLRAYFDTSEECAEPNRKRDSVNVIEAWHAVMDCLTVRYFYLLDASTPNLREVNALGYEGKYHSGLTDAELTSPISQLRGYRENLRYAVEFVRSGSPLVGPESAHLRTV
jgi:hypothetical protein